MNKPKKLLQKQKEGIIQLIKAQLKHRKEIVFAYIYGSFVDGKYFRDVDVAVYVDEQAVAEDKALDYAFKLADVLEVAIKLPVDVRVLNYTPLGFQYHVTTGELLTCRDDDLRAYVVGKIWSLYFDQLPTVKRFLKEMVGG